MRLSCIDTWKKMSEMTMDGTILGNFHQLIDMSDYLVETELFNKECLEAYSSWNLENQITDDQLHYFSDLRGGSQGDYRLGMKKKIANVVDALDRFPNSKELLLQFLEPHFQIIATMMMLSVCVRYTFTCKMEA